VTTPDEQKRPSGEAYCPSCDRSYESTVKTCPDDGTRLVEIGRPSDPLIGREIDGRFVIRERLGAGGMGVVYRAWQASVGREVAIKVIAPRPGDERAVARRFLREAKLASQLSHPNIVMVIDFGATPEGTLYLAMELLRGRTLGQVWQAEGVFSPKRMLRVASQLCDALETAQRAGIVHRDLKPANVMILDEPPGRDFVKVLDFGLAKALDPAVTTLTQSDRLVGTPSYMAPEVISGAPASPSADLYSLGVLLFEMLTGKLPYTAPNVTVMLARHTYAPVPDLGDHVPPQVQHVVKRLLAKQPEHRYRNAAELRDVLEAAVAGTLRIDASEEALIETADTPSQPVEAPPRATPTPIETAPTMSDLSVMPPKPRRRAGLVVATVILAAGAAVGAFAILNQSKPRAPSAAPPDARMEMAVPPTIDAAVAPPAAIDAGVVDAGVIKKDDRRRPRNPRTTRDAGAVRTAPPPDAAPKPPPPRKPDAGPTFVDPT
jgi:serine/threonine-protein kinase